MHSIQRLYYLIGGQLGRARWAGTGTARESTAQTQPGSWPRGPVPCPCQAPGRAWAAIPARGTSTGPARLRHQHGAARSRPVNPRVAPLPSPSFSRQPTGDSPLASLLSGRSRRSPSGRSRRAAPPRPPQRHSPLWPDPPRRSLPPVRELGPRLRRARIWPPFATSDLARGRRHRPLRSLAFALLLCSASSPWPRRPPRGPGRSRRATSVAASLAFAASRRRPAAARPRPPRRRRQGPPPPPPVACAAAPVFPAMVRPGRRRSGLPCCRAQEHGPARRRPRRAVPGPGWRHGGTTRHGTAAPPCPGVPCLPVPVPAVLGSCPCRAARLATYTA